MLQIGLCTIPLGSDWTKVSTFFLILGFLRGKDFVLFNTWECAATVP